MCRTGENIRKRKDGRWEGRIQIMSDSGLKKVKSLYGKTYHDVKKKMALSKENLNYAEAINNHSFECVSKEWLSLQSTNHKESTVLKYKTIIDSHLIPFWGNRNIEDVDEKQIAAFIAEKSKSGNLKDQKPLSSAYTKLIIIVLKSIINYSVGMGYRKPMNSFYIHKPTIVRKESNYLDNAYFTLLNQYIREHTDGTTVAISLALFSGLRIGEICALQWGDIDFANNVIFIRHTVTRVLNENPSISKTKLMIGEPKTNSSKRTIPIIHELKEVLLSINSNALPTIYVITATESFISPRTLDYRFHQVLRDLNIPSINFHALRHSFATRCVEVGVDAKTVSELLGHATVDITLNTYVHSSMDRKRNELSKLSDCMV